MCERSDLVLVCPVVSTWTRNNATVCSDPRTCVISGVSSNDFGVYLCGGNVYSVHVLIREGKTPVLYESCCNPRCSQKVESVSYHSAIIQTSIFGFFTASSGNCSPPSWRIAIGALFFLFAVTLFVGCVASLTLAETIRKLCCGLFD